MPLNIVILNIVQIVARIVIAVQLCRLVRKKALDNFYWFAVYFLLLAFVDLAAVVLFGFGLIETALKSLNFSTIVTLNMFPLVLSDICLAVFVGKTFYQDRKSVAPVFLGIAIMWAVLTIILLSLEPAMYVPVNPFIILWAAFAALAAYHEIVRDKSIEDWVKGRYVLSVFAGFFMVIPAVESMIAAIRFGLYKPYDTLSVLGLVSVISAVALYYLAWIMPEPLRRLLNRNYIQPESVVDMSEEEVMKKLHKSSA